MAAAARARERIQARLEQLAGEEPPIEVRFTLADQWSRHLFVALLRRYGIQPYRYPRQRRTTVMARASSSFVDEILYFTIPDRFNDGDAANNCGEYPGSCAAGGEHAANSERARADDGGGCITGRPHRVRAQNVRQGGDSDRLGDERLGHQHQGEGKIYRRRAALRYS